MKEMISSVKNEPLSPPLRSPITKDSSIQDIQKRHNELTDHISTIENELRVIKKYHPNYITDRMAPPRYLYGPLRNGLGEAKDRKDYQLCRKALPASLLIVLSAFVGSLSVTYHNDKNGEQFLAQSGFINQVISPEDDGEYADYIRQVRNATGSKIVNLPNYGKIEKTNSANLLLPDQLEEIIKPIKVPQKLLDGTNLSEDSFESGMAQTLYIIDKDNITEKLKNKEYSYFFLKNIMKYTSGTVSASCLLIALGFVGGWIVQHNSFKKRRKEELDATREVYDKEFGFMDKDTLDYITNKIFYVNKTKNHFKGNEEDEHLVKTLEGISLKLNVIAEEKLHNDFEKEEYQNNLIEYTINSIVSKKNAHLKELS